MKEISLCELRVGQSAVISGLENSGSMRRRLIDLGFADKSEVSCVLKAPLGDPKAYLIKNTVIALRKEDSEKIKVVVE